MNSYEGSSAGSSPGPWGSKRALFKQLLSLVLAAKLNNVEVRIRRLEDMTRRYEGLPGKTLEEDLRALLLVDVCHKDLREVMALENMDLEYSGAKRS